MRKRDIYEIVKFVLGVIMLWSTCFTINVLMFDIDILRAIYYAFMSIIIVWCIEAFNTLIKIYKFNKKLKRREWR